jgi:ABC-type transporter Mla MlaB component
MDVNEENRIACGDSLDISVVHELHPQLKRVLQFGDDVLLDVSTVERADTAALQLLYAFIQEATANGVTVHWHEPTTALYDAASLLGLEAELGLPNHR